MCLGLRSRSKERLKKEENDYFNFFVKMHSFNKAQNTSCFKFEKYNLFFKVKKRQLNDAAPTQRDKKQIFVSLSVFSLLITIVSCFALSFHFIIILLNKE
jgi:hypothetical protein